MARCAKPELCCRENFILIDDYVHRTDIDFTGCVELAPNGSAKAWFVAALSLGFKRHDIPQT